LKTLPGGFSGEAVGAVVNPEVDETNKVMKNCGNMGSKKAKHDFLGSFKLLGTMEVAKTFIERCDV
jgi:hypothetical protein